MMQYLFIAVIVLQVLDAYTTYTAIGKGAVEANKLLKPLFAKAGILPVMAIKGAFTIALAYYIPGTQIGLCIVYALAVANNFRVIYK